MKRVANEGWPGATPGLLYDTRPLHRFLDRFFGVVSGKAGLRSASFSLLTFLSLEAPFPFFSSGVVLFYPLG